jgi:hypothetical protein
MVAATFAVSPARAENLVKVGSTEQFGIARNEDTGVCNAYADTRAGQKVAFTRQNVTVYVPPNRAALGQTTDVLADFDRSRSYNVKGTWSWSQDLHMNLLTIEATQDFMWDFLNRNLMSLSVPSSGRNEQLIDLNLLGTKTAMMRVDECQRASDEARANAIINNAAVPAASAPAADTPAALAPPIPPTHAPLPNNNADDTAAGIVAAILGLGGVVVISLIFFHFLPIIVALMRGKADGKFGIFLVNLFFGWTLIGWILAFIWACTGDTKADLTKKERERLEFLAAMKGRA